MTSKLRSYSKIMNVGHVRAAALNSIKVIVEEKIDGSQFSFGRIDGVYHARSKGVALDPENPEGMFKRAIENTIDLDVKDGWVYRCEFLGKPKHNTLAYERVPAKHVIVFDIEPQEGDFLGHQAKREESARMGLETVHLFTSGAMPTADEIREFMIQPSALGDEKIEGVVIKPKMDEPGQVIPFTPDGKVLMAKHVSERFKEQHQTSWKVSNPGPTDIRVSIGGAYAVEARWRKAVQRARDEGRLSGEPKDIGRLVKSVQADVMAEEEDAIKQALYDWAKGHIRRGCVKGFPEWYKDELLTQQYQETSEG